MFLKTSKSYIKISMVVLLAFVLLSTTLATSLPKEQLSRINIHHSDCLTQKLGSSIGGNNSLILLDLMRIYAHIILDNAFDRLEDEIIDDDNDGDDGDSQQEEKETKNQTSEGENQDNDPDDGTGENKPKQGEKPDETKTEDDVSKIDGNSGDHPQDPPVIEHERNLYHNHNNPETDGRYKPGSPKV